MLAGVAAHAAAAARAFLASPDLYQCDLLDMAAVRHLQGDATHGPVHALLTVFLTGQLADYLAFAAKQPGVVPGLGLDHEACVAKMRLASLAALGSDGASEGAVSYAQVQAALQVEAGEVEAWVVRAIGAGVLEAKMDQVRRTVLITRSLHRVFGRQQWVELAAKLRTYSDNIGAALASTPMPAALEIVA